MPPQIPTKQWKAFLKTLGLVHVRTESSHELWDRPDDSLDRPIVIKSNCKDVPDLHIRTSLRILGMTRKEFERKFRKQR